jgi:hypothetical protein
MLNIFVKYVYLASNAEIQQQDKRSDLDSVNSSVPATKASKGIKSIVTALYRMYWYLIFLKYTCI